VPPQKNTEFKECLVVAWMSG